MLPFNMSFRKMVFKYIPQLKAEDLDRHEGLLAFRHRVIQERKIKKTTARNHNYKQTTLEANAILSPYGKLFAAVQKLYSAKKQYAQQQGNFQQIPSSPEGMRQLVKATANYRWIQIQTLPLLWGNRLGYYVKNYWRPYLISLLAISGLSYKLMFGGVTPINHPPVMNPIPVDTAFVGLLYQYQVIVTDPDSMDILSYTLTKKPTYLSINPSTGMITGTPGFLDIGIDTIGVKVTDSGGLFDTQTYDLIVTN